MPESSATTNTGAYSEIKSSGITSKTPGNILLGAGTIHKGLKYDQTKKTWNFAESLIGATQGGNKLSIKPEITQIEVDGAWVPVKQLDVKQGGSASLEINLVELSTDILKYVVIGQEAVNAPDGYTVIEDKSKIEKGDYLDNIAFIGKRIDGVPIIVILDNALCTSGLELEGKDKDASVTTYTFESRQDISGDLTTIPYHIYFPKAA